MNTFIKTISLLISLGSVMGAYGQAPAAPATAPPSEAAKQSNAPVAAMPSSTPTADYCPAPNQLTKKDLLWSAPGGWVSYGESFDRRVTGFVKVQWIGINLGKIICLYSGDRRYEFPIALEQKQNKIAASPQGENWGHDRGGYKECISTRVDDCPFQFQQPKKIDDVYKELDFLKGKTGY